MELHHADLIQAEIFMIRFLSNIYIRYIEIRILRNSNIRIYFAYLFLKIEARKKKKSFPIFFHEIFAESIFLCGINLRYQLRCQFLEDLISFLGPSYKRYPKLLHDRMISLRKSQIPFASASFDMLQALNL